MAVVDWLTDTLYSGQVERLHKHESSLSFSLLTCHHEQEPLHLKTRNLFQHLPYSVLIWSPYLKETRKNRRKSCIPCQNSKKKKKKKNFHLLSCVTSLVLLRYYPEIRLSFFECFFLWPHSRHMKVPEPGIES